MRGGPEWRARTPWQQGFTLLELMIVVTVVGILAAIAIPSYQSYVVHAKVAEGYIFASSLKTAVAESLMIDGRYPDSNEAAYLDPPEAIGGRYVRSVAIRPGGVIEVTFGDPMIDGETLTLTPSGDRGIRWECSATLPANYLPASCRDGANAPPGDPGSPPGGPPGGGPPGGGPPGGGPPGGGPPGGGPPGGGPPGGGPPGGGPPGGVPPGQSGGSPGNSGNAPGRNK